MLVAVASERDTWLDNGTRPLIIRRVRTHLHIADCGANAQRCTHRTRR